MVTKLQHLIEIVLNAACQLKSKYQKYFSYYRLYWIVILDWNFSHPKQTIFLNFLFFRTFKGKMSFSVIIKLLIRINLIPLSSGQENGKFYFSWFSLRTFSNLFVLYGLSLSCLIYYTYFTNYTFDMDTPMEFARYVKTLKCDSRF